MGIGVQDTDQRVCEPWHRYGKHWVPALVERIRKGIISSPVATRVRPPRSDDLVAQWELLRDGGPDPPGVGSQLWFP